MSQAGTCWHLLAGNTLAPRQHKSSAMLAPGWSEVEGKSPPGEHMNPIDAGAATPACSLHTEQAEVLQGSEPGPQRNT